MSFPILWLNTLQTESGPSIQPFFTLHINSVLLLDFDVNGAITNNKNPKRLFKKAPGCCTILAFMHMQARIPKDGNQFFECHPVVTPTKYSQYLTPTWYFYYWVCE